MLATRSAANPARSRTCASSPKRSQALRRGRRRMQSSAQARRPPRSGRSGQDRRGCSIWSDAAVRAVSARLLLLCLLLRSSWLAAEGRRQVGAARVLHRPGPTGSCGRVGGRGCWRSEPAVSPTAIWSPTTAGTGPQRQRNFCTPIARSSRVTPSLGQSPESSDWGAEGSSRRSALSRPSRLPLRRLR